MRKKSTIRINTASATPPAQPPVMPTIAPTSKAPPPPATAANMETRAPERSWLQRSWPTELVPTKCWVPGAMSGSPASAVVR